MDKIDLFLNKEYIKFYSEELRPKQENIINMLNGNICRICVCDTEDELYLQYYHACNKIHDLVLLQQRKFNKIKEIEELNETKR